MHRSMNIATRCQYFADKSYSEKVTEQDIHPHVHWLKVAIVCVFWNQCKLMYDC